MLIWKMAWKIVDRSRLIYSFLFVQQTITFFVYMIVFSLFFYHAEDYLRFRDFFCRQGLYLQVSEVYDETNRYPITDSKDLEANLPGMQVIGSYRISGNFQLNQTSVTISARSYDEEIRDRMQPEMKEGKWLNDRDSAEISQGAVRGVITDSIYGIQPGDQIQLRGWMGDWEPVTVEIVGVMKRAASFWGYSITDDRELDFRSCWESAGFKEPVLFLDKEEIRQKLQENPDSGIVMSLYNSALVLYEEGAGEAQIRSGQQYLNSHGQYGIIENLSTVNENSRDYLRQQGTQLFPGAAAALLFSLVSGIGIKAILMGLNEKYCAVLRLCGCTKRQWMRIYAAACFLINGAAFLLSMWMARMMEKQLFSEFSFVTLSWSSVLFCLLAAAVDMAAAWIITGSIWNRDSEADVLKALGEEKRI